MRTANFRYLETNQIKNIEDAIEKLLEDYIYPNARFMNGDHFRKHYCYNMNINDVLKKNEFQIKRLYSSFCHSKKKYIVLAEAKEFVRKLDLNVSELMVGAMYAESMMTIIDNMSDTSRSQ